MNRSESPPGDEAPPTTTEVSAAALALYTSLSASFVGKDPAVVRVALGRAAKGDAALAEELRRLASQDGALGVSGDVAQGGAVPEELAPGALLAGRYRLVRRLGEGGAGVVHLALQEVPVKRQVAVKVLPSALEGARAELRFEAEKNALSRMSHPFVAGIYDAGRTLSGRPYVVMEYVQGEPIDVWCRQRQLDLAGRLKLFVDVCRGVHHAHSKGIVHRDLKPANILVTEKEGAAVPKLIDFGIAKVTMGLAQESRVTLSGFFVGTPEYMSPEQAGAGDGDVDTISDVYSLGVVLYELLTGELPFDPAAVPRSRASNPESNNITAWQRLLASGEPVKPSARLERARGGASRPERIGPADLRGDLDSISMKALARERERRYQTASELAADIERHLSKQPIVARPPTFLYTASRLLRRHLALVIGVLLVIASLGVALAVVNDLAVERAGERRVLETARLRAEVERRHAREKGALAERMKARSDLAQARAALDVADAAGVKRSLAAIPPALRAWEARWLEHQADRSMYSIAAHQGPVTALSLSRDDELLISGGADGEVAVWLVQDGTELARFQVSTGPIRALANGPRARMAVIAVDGALLGWDLELGREAWRREGDFALEAGAVALLGKNFVTVNRGDPIGGRGRRATIEVCDVASGGPMWTVPVPEPVVDVVFYAADDAIVYASNHFTTVLAADGSRRQLPGFLPRTDPERRVLSLKPWDRWDAREHYDMATGEHVGTVVSSGPAFLAFGLGPEGLIATSEEVRTLSLRDSPRAPPRVTLAGHEGPIEAMVFERGGHGLLVGDAAGTIKRWSPWMDSAPMVIEATNDPVFGAVIDRAGGFVATSGWGVVKRWDASTGAELWTRFLGRKYMTALEVAADGALLVADWGGDLWKLRAADGEPLDRVRVLEGSILRIAAAPGAARASGREGFVVTTRSGEVGLYELGERRLAWRRTVHPESPVMALAVSPDGRWIATGGSAPSSLPSVEGAPMMPRDPYVRLSALDTGEPGPQLTPSVGPWTSVVFSPDGRQLAAGAEDGTVAIWTLPDGRLRVRAPGVGGRIQALAFTPTGDRLVFAHHLGVLGMWDVETLDPLMVLPGPRMALERLTFTSDGATLLGAGDPHAIVAWESRPRASAEERARVKSLRREIDQRLARASGVAEVERLIAADPRPDPAWRDAAIAAARARGDQPNMLNSWAWAIVRQPSDSRESIALARRRAEVVADANVIWQFENTRAVARYRDGDMDGAIASAERSIALQRAEGLETHPIDRAIIAMASWRLGRGDVAREVLAKAREDADRAPWRGDSEVARMIIEARDLIEE